MSSADRVIAFNAIFAVFDVDPHAVSKEVKTLVHEAALKYARTSGWRPPAEGPVAPVREHQSHTGEPVEDFAMPFGRDKGRMLSTLDVRSLQWWEGVFRRDLEDPEKARFHARAQKQLDAVRACLRNKGEAANYGD